ncbi:MOSC domain-containing protein [Adhaeribacter rhizoryzae]|uniref:MOSC domain-containing protein n=1 Tax=Adhaeribacter rhizoryzae TaxID=2607907 RepID=A0A5M6DQ21_9BACT|nr:MOSC N-terminal beta barrel domain-containing protein [Adhaeribacter rhizoryzae]KAA5548280.1 MOSC domain-containing protein [Adhaeribacter rhizoryzae]
MENLLKISQINIYPIKSLGGISVEAATVEPRGLQHDRRWLLVDENGKFLTQRTFAEMALLQVSLVPDGLAVKHKTNNIAPLFIPFKPTTNNILEVQIWDDSCQAVEVSPAANKWFSATLGRFCRLVYMPDTTQRQADLDYAHPGDIVSFADSYPLLFIGESSLNDLNSRLPEAVPMNRFRPSVVFTGGLPFAEDTWAHFQIGNLSFRGVKPCARCVLTTIDQASAQKSPEPLRTLATYRTAPGKNKVLFGQNVIPDNFYSQLKVGDYITVKKIVSAPV